MINDTKISAGNLSYICARNRQQAYNLIIRALKKSGLTQAQLARRLGKDTASISRLLKMPQNWELNTMSELYYGACGAALNFGSDYPHAQALSHHVAGTLGADRSPTTDLSVITFATFPAEEPMYKPRVNTQAESKRKAGEKNPTEVEYTYATC